MRGAVSELCLKRREDYMRTALFMNLAQKIRFIPNFMRINP